jgi:hypothetical protein
LVTYVFYSMCHARHAILVAEVADIDIKGCTGLVCLGVMDEESLELIRQADDAIVAVVERGLLQVVGQQDGAWTRGRCRKLGGAHRSRGVSE